MPRQSVVDLRFDWFVSEIMGKAHEASVWGALCFTQTMVRLT